MMSKKSSCATVAAENVSTAEASKSIYDRQTFFSPSDDIVSMLSLGLFVADRGCRKGRLPSPPMRPHFFSRSGGRSLGLLYSIKQFNDYMHRGN